MKWKYVCQGTENGSSRSYLRNPNDSCDCVRVSNMESLGLIIMRLFVEVLNNGNLGLVLYSDAFFSIR